MFWGIWRISFWVCRSFAYYTLRTRLPCTLRALIASLQIEYQRPDLIVGITLWQNLHQWHEWIVNNTWILIILGEGEKWIPTHHRKCYAIEGNSGGGWHPRLFWMPWLEIEAVSRSLPLTPPNQRDFSGICSSCSNSGLRCLESVLKWDSCPEENILPGLLAVCRLLRLPAPFLLLRE